MYCMRPLLGPPVMEAEDYIPHINSPNVFCMLNWNTFARVAMFQQQCFLVQPGPNVHAGEADIPVHLYSCLWKSWRLTFSKREFRLNTFIFLKF